MPKAKLSQELEKPAWLKIKEDELKTIISHLAEKYQPAEVGLILRDQYGIPTTRVYGKKLKDYLKELKIESNEEIKNIEKKFERLKMHTKKNLQDKKAKHKLQKTQSKLNRLKRYHNKK